MKLVNSILIFLLLTFKGFGQEAPIILSGHLGNVNSVVFTPDNRQLLSVGQDGTIRIYDVINNLSFIRSIKISNAAIKSINFSPSGKEFCIGGFTDFTTYSYPLFNKICKRKKAHTTFVESANYSNDGKLIVTTSWRDNCLTLWNSSKLQKVVDFKEENWTKPAIFLPNNNFIASGNHLNTIRIWNIANGNIERTFAGHSDWVESLFITKDGKYLVSASLDKTIKVWDLTTGKIFKTIDTFENGVNALALSTDGKYFASACLDKTIKIWNAETFNEITTLNGQDCIALNLAFSHDGKYLATSGMDKTVKVWKVDQYLK